MDIGWATLVLACYGRYAEQKKEGELERVIFQNNDLKSSWLLEAYKSKGICFNLKGVTQTGFLIEVEDDEQADKEIGVYIGPHINTSYLGKGEGAYGLFALQHENILKTVLQEIWYILKLDFYQKNALLFLMEILKKCL